LDGVQTVPAKISTGRNDKWRGVERSLNEKDGKWRGFDEVAALNGDVIDRIRQGPVDGIDEQQAAAFAKELSELSKEQSEALFARP
jgi:hypothetical protein